MLESQLLQKKLPDVLKTLNACLYKYRKIHLNMQINLAYNKNSNDQPMIKCMISPSVI